MTEISKMPGFPSMGVIARWRAENEEFDKMVVMARKARAELFQDKIIASVDEDVDKDDVPSEKHKFDKLKWLAEKNDPDTFGNKTRISGDSSAPLQIIVETGIMRSEEPKPVEGEVV
jgi:hypothetical protein